MDEKPIFKPGDKVRMKVLIQSDDRENGLDDGSPIFPEGTIGTIVGKSKVKSKDIKLKQDDCWEIKFDTGYRFDIHISEMELVEEQDKD